LPVRLALRYEEIAKNQYSGGRDKNNLSRLCVKNVWTEKSLNSPINKWLWKAIVRPISTAKAVREHWDFNSEFAPNRR